ncbi:MAG: DNA polymerase III subunit epsilon [Janthinobacterium lividum]
MSALREIILDTETTGLDPLEGHRIVEIGALEMKNKVVTGNKFHYYINPQRDMPTEAYRIHGISGEFLKNKPLFANIAEEFLQFIGNAKLVIHNAPFDIKFLNHELSLINKPSLELSSAIDTLIMARQMFPGMRTNLDALCKRFKVDNSGRKLHGALRDAALLADVYVELTGGRQAAFIISSNLRQESSISTNNNYFAITNGKNIVVAPTKAELEKHKLFLAKINSPIWSS